MHNPTAVSFIQCRLSLFPALSTLQDSGSVAPVRQLRLGQASCGRNDPSGGGKRSTRGCCSPKCAERSGQLDEKCDLSSKMIGITIMSYIVYNCLSR